jgi:STE24 endopeptidase
MPLFGRAPAPPPPGAAAAALARLARWRRGGGAPPPPARWWRLSAATPYLEIVTGFTALIAAAHLLLDLRQLRALRAPRPPPETRALFKSGEFEKARAYQLDRLRFGAARTAFDAASGVALARWGYWGTTWAFAGRALAAAGAPAGDLWQSAAWSAILVLAGAAMALPWSACSALIEARHGFNRQSPAGFVADAVKSTALSLALAPAAAAAAAAILGAAGPLMPLYLWAFILALSLATTALAPTLIMPLFNTYTPLEAGPLRAKIEALAARVGFPLTKLYVVDGSKRSGHSNAFLYGFGSHKRIVLYDTLLAQCSEAEVVAVLAHELGHWRLGHAPAMFAVGQAAVGAQLALFAAARQAPGLHAAFGFAPGARPALAALLLLGLLTGPADEALGVAANAVSRRLEFQADAHAAALGHAAPMRAALLALHRENKGPPAVDGWYSFCHLSHPSLAERLAALAAAARKAE